MDAGVVPLSTANIATVGPSVCRFMTPSNILCLCPLPQLDVSSRDMYTSSRHKLTLTLWQKLQLTVDVDGCPSPRHICLNRLSEQCLPSFEVFILSDRLTGSVYPGQLVKVPSVISVTIEHTHTHELYACSSLLLWLLVRNSICAECIICY